MNIQSSHIKDRGFSFIRANLLFTFLFLGGIVLVGMSMFPKDKKEDIQLVHEEKEIPSQAIFVDVSGAVVNPGLYKLDQTARIQDALVMAGGFSSEADESYIAQYLNLAQKLTDGMKLYIPKQNETRIIGQSVAGLQTKSEKININSATLKELDSLPAVGEITASKIIEGRPYQDTIDLVEKKIIGQKTYDKIKDSISVY